MSKIEKGIGGGWRVGVFFGSRSPEHDISIITGQLIVSGLKGMGYNIVPVYVTKKGEWLIDEKLGELRTFTDSTRHFDISGFRRFYLDLEKSRGKIVFRKKGLGGKEIVVDIAFPALHGSYGEDGTIQGLFEMLDVPYVGCGVSASAVAMDKILTKLFYVANNILTTKFVFFSGDEWTTQKSEILAKLNRNLKYPLFVKPPLLGSSIGMAKVKTGEDLGLAVEVALHYGSRVLVEESVEDLMDITCCVMGNEHPIASLLQESVFQGSDFFSYDEKYLKDGGTQLGKAQNNIVIPARLDPQTSEEIRRQAVEIYKIFGCFGIARIDFLYDRKGQRCYANEINPMPGTLYHHLWKASGVELPDLLAKLLGFAAARQDSKKKVIYTFDSEILRKAGSAKLNLKK